MSGFLELAKNERWSLAGAAAAHLDLVLEALVIAVAIGVPLGILATRSKWAERVVVGLANVLQTVPSLALLGFLLILFHGMIGKPPARAALVIYALLPIIKNTVLGLRSLDRGVAEAALGMGMTAWQRLWIVELPLAVPIILGGVRVAAVASVGMATIAAAIGAKGLGNYIFRGVSLADSRLILLGSIPAALLALACDAALGEVEHALDPIKIRRSLLRSGLAGLAVLALLCLALAGAWADWMSERGDSPTIAIGSKDSAEPIILGHMLADLVEAHANLHADRRLNLGGTLVCYNALRQGGLDVYVEYTGTLLTTILHEPPMNDPRRVLGRVRELCQRDGIECLDPLGFENTFAILMRRSQAERLGIKKISDLRDHVATIRAGFGPEFMNRADGYPGLVQAYDLHFAHAPREMDRNLLYEAVARGTLDLAAGDSTDGRVARLDLVQLRDDRHYFPPYEAVPLVRRETLREYPQLRTVLNGLAGKLDAETMRRLNNEVDGLHRDPAQVAREYLSAAKLVEHDRVPRRSSIGSWAIEQCVRVAQRRAFADGHDSRLNPREASGARLLSLAAAVTTQLPTSHVGNSRDDADDRRGNQNQRPRTSEGNDRQHEEELQGRGELTQQSGLQMRHGRPAAPKNHCCAASEDGQVAELDEGNFSEPHSTLDQQGHEDAGHEELVGNRIEDLAGSAGSVQPATQGSIEKVAHSRDHDDARTRADRGKRKDDGQDDPNDREQVRYDPAHPRDPGHPILLSNETRRETCTRVCNSSVELPRHIRFAGLPGIRPR